MLKEAAAAIALREAALMEPESCSAKTKVVTYNSIAKCWREMKNDETEMKERREEHTDRQGEEEKRGSNWEEEDGRMDVLKAVNRVRAIMLMDEGYSLLSLK